MEAHQDTKYPDRPLTWEAKLNKRSDDIASEYLEKSTQQIKKPTPLPEGKITINVNNTTITNHYARRLRNLANLPALRDYMTTKFVWNHHVFDTVDWQTYHKRTTDLSFLKRLFAIKWLHNIIPLQARLHKMNLSPCADCPSACGCTSETKAHFIQCPHPQRRQLWEQLDETLTITFDTWNIDPHLQTITQQLLFPENVDPDKTAALPDQFAMLLTKQVEIGQFSMLDGLLAQGWTTYQEEYLIAKKLPHEHHQANRGIQAILADCINHIHELWLTCNSHLHGMDPRNKTAYKHQHLFTMIY